MAENIFGLTLNGWMPNTLTEDPVMWQRQEFNQLADYIVNLSVDRAETWENTLRLRLWTSLGMKRNKYVTLTAAPEAGHALRQAGSWKQW